MQNSLRLDWIGRSSAAKACRMWHYSKTMPVSPGVSLGVWEGSRFIGALIYARGANRNMGAPYGLAQHQCLELVRVALNKHDAPVSRIIAISIRLIKKQYPGLELIVSYADPEEGHAGTIYQAGNWIYSGDTATSFEWRLNGARLQKRAFTGSNFGGKKSVLPAGAIRVRTKPKHRYLMPLTKPMRVRVSALAQPYPKRVSSSEPSENPSEVGGAAPTLTLHPSPTTLERD